MNICTSGVRDMSGLLSAEDCGQSGPGPIHLRYGDRSWRGMWLIVGSWADSSSIVIRLHFGNKEREFFSDVDTHETLISDVSLSIRQ